MNQLAIQFFGQLEQLAAADNDTGSHSPVEMIEQNTFYKCKHFLFKKIFCKAPERCGWINIFQTKLKYLLNKFEL